jgi:glutamate N-acetyltransferase/amino-acid N-acetyltransferase
LSVLLLDEGSVVGGVFTQNRFCAAPVQICREHLGLHGGLTQGIRAMLINTGNANAGTGADGLARAHSTCSALASLLGVDAEQILPFSTGVIMEPLPFERIEAGLAAAIADAKPGNWLRAAQGIMTTDTVAKVAEASAGTARVVGVAKGVGMIEPDMATLITLLFTDARVEPSVLDAMFRRVIDRTFNCVSIDTDTSTSDTAIIMASGEAGAVDLAVLESAVHEVALSLTKQVARDGEGAETLIEVHVDAARDDEQAKTVAKSIVNSPLVKTAIHGADPNWGRVAMAIGKCSEYADINQERVVIRFGTQEVFPSAVSTDGLDRLATYMRGEHVRIHVSLGTGDAHATVWGCDLTDGYVRINADYTT